MDIIWLILLSHPYSVGDALDKASGEFVRLGSIVTGGLLSIVTNFSKVAGQLSGPVAIVAAGSEIAKSDSAGLFQVRKSTFLSFNLIFLCYLHMQTCTVNGGGCMKVHSFI